MDLTGSGYGPIAGFCEHGNEPSGYIKGWELLDQLSDCEVLKEEPATGVNPLKPSGYFMCRQV
jgi:hypothetical protein